MRQVREDRATLLEPESLRPLGRDCGHRGRERLLSPLTTIHLFALQVRHGNTTCAHLPLSGMAFSDPAYCRARARLSLAVFQALLRRLAATCEPLTDTVGLWHGHCTRLVNGTGVSLPDTPALQRAFGQPTNQAVGCGFPVARVRALFHAGTGVTPALPHRAAALARDVARRPAAPGPAPR